MDRFRVGPTYFMFCGKETTQGGWSLCRIGVIVVRPGQPRGRFDWCLLPVTYKPITNSHDGLTHFPIPIYLPTYCSVRLDTPFHG